MLILNDILLTFKDRTLFNKLSLSIDYHEKAGLIGRNGSGKSTLLNVIAGQQNLDSGLITYDKKKKIGYLPQELILSSYKSVFDETMMVFADYVQMQKEAHLIEQKLADGMDDVSAHQAMERYTSIQEQLVHFDFPVALTKAEAILRGLGFSEKQRTQSVDSLSVGWRMRVVLAKLLLQEADFYLFDEPTNHLDLPAKEWFLSLLNSASFGYLLVSHDRYFLEKACEKIIEIERGVATTYKGNFGAYLTQKEQQRERTLAAHAQQQKEIARKQQTIDRFRFKASKAAMVRSMIKELDAMERVEIERTLPQVSFSFAPAVRSGTVVLTLDKVSHTFDGNELFKNLSCTITRGKKVAIIAANGKGKTTLFNLITGKLPLQKGSITFGHKVTTAYFEQDQARVMNKDNSVLKEVLDACSSVPEQRARSFLGAFLFSGDETKKKISQLSGGEKNRVAMVKVLLQNANMLLLDEPTNHLDLYAKDVLKQALQQYDGTMLFVSHDHDFVQQVADTILELTPNGLYHYDGDYESYLYHKRMTESHQQQNEAQEHAVERPQKEFQKDGARHQKIQKQLGLLEHEIKKLEEKRDALGERLASLEYGTKAYDDLLAQFSSLDKELREKNHAWDECMQNYLVLEK